MKNNISDKWLEKYNLAKDYYEEHGVLLIPKSYSLTMNDEIKKLGNWINNQRRFYKQGKLNDEQINLLNKIGMIWDVKLYKDENKKYYIPNEWFEKYNLAKAYYEKHGNLLIRQNYSAVINNEVINLGVWIAKQRKLYKNDKLNEEQIELLNKIGMVWEITKYKNYLKEIEEKILLSNIFSYDIKSINQLLDNEIIKYKDDDTIMNTIKMLKKKYNDE